MKDALNDHLNRASRTPLLTPEEEIILGRAVQRARALQEEKPTGPYSREEQRVLTRGKRAKERMITANLRLVANITRRYGRVIKEVTGDPADMYQDGVVGLMRAVELFDPERGYKFSTYAYWWIRQGITRGLSQNSRCVRLPIHVHETLGAREKNRQRLTQELGRQPTVAEMAAALNMNEADYRQFVALTEHVSSLDAHAGSDEERDQIIDMISDGGSADEDLEVMHTRLDVEMVREALEALLNDKQRYCVTKWFGLDGGDPQTQAQVAKDLGIHREAVRQHLSRAIRKLRVHLANKPQVQEQVLRPWKLRAESGAAVAA